jgi:Xaa-Pro aminopeptidase
MNQNAEYFFKEHLVKIRRQMERNNADLMFLGFGTEFSYITGTVVASHYPDSRVWGDWVDGIVFSLDKDPVLIHRERYAEPDLSPLYNVAEKIIMPMDFPNPNEYLKKAFDLFDTKNKTIAISKKTWGQTVLGIMEAAPQAKVVAFADPIIDEARVVKDEYEISLMREAGRITSDIFDSLIKKLRVGMNVHDVKAELAFETLRRGSFPFSFSPGVVCVNKDSDPKARNNPENILLPQSSLSFDYGIIYSGYKTDFGRTLFIGEPQEEARRAYKVITDIVQEVTSLLGDEKLTPYDMFEVGNSRAKETGFYEGYGYYQWSIGHSIGTDLHEWPWLRSPHESAMRPIKAGMIFAVEPKINGWGQYYLRCEDNILVGKEKGEVLTPFTYDPVIIQ